MTDKGDRIKTALEIAMERAQKIKVSKEELDRQKYIDEGRKLAGRYLTHEDFDLENALGFYKGKIRGWVEEGVRSVFHMKLTLPKNEQIKVENERVLKGMLLLKKDKRKVDRIRMLFNSYEKNYEAAYERLKMEFESRLGETKRTLENLGFTVEVEDQPQFKEKWAQVVGELDLKYEEVLKQYLSDR